MKATAARVHDKRRARKKTTNATNEPLFPLAIRVIFNRVPVCYPIGEDLSEDEFRKLSSPRLGERLSKVKDKFENEEKRARDIIKNLGTFTFQAFRERFYQDDPVRNARREKKLATASRTINTSLDPGLKPTHSEGKMITYGRKKYDRIRSNVDYEKMGPLAVAFGEKIKILETRERIGTSELYFSALISLLDFKPGLRLEDITEEFLYAYEKWFLGQGNTETSEGIYLRNLRAIINRPKNKKLFTEDRYPFGKEKFQIPTGTNTKKALDPVEIKLIYDYQQQTKEESEMYARDMWLYGFFANGINPKDIAYLQNKNFVDDDYIQILRQKTKNTTRSKPKQLIVPINDDMRRIRKRWGNPDTDPDAYVFPILSHGLSAHRRRELVLGFVCLLNTWMKFIAGILGIKKKVRTMEWRHTMATILKRAGASTEFIKETMGHTSLSTTENYLDSFEIDVKKQYAKHLLSFKDIQSQPGMR